MPADALHLLPGEGGDVGAALVSDPRIAGVGFTGSTETAWAIDRAMAGDATPRSAPLIAETGGLNAMIVDSHRAARAGGRATCSTSPSARPASAARRCASSTSRRTSPTAVDRDARGRDGRAAARRPWRARDRCRPGHRRAQPERGSIAHIAGDEPRRPAALPAARSTSATSSGSFVAPTADRDRPASTTSTARVFGPVLHVVALQGRRARRRWSTAINATGYGLTFGIHSPHRRDASSTSSRRIRAGNIYVNRNRSAPSSAPSPSAARACPAPAPRPAAPTISYASATERTVTVNTAAMGGNLALLGALQDRPASA